MRGFTVVPTTYCFTSGSPVGSTNDPRGLSFLKFCITDRGNISYFESPGGKVHLNNREGYVVCSIGGVIHGFDAGIAEEGWGKPTVSQPQGTGKLPLVITRDSLDGKVRLIQTFTMVQADREIQVTMDLKNISPSQMGFALARYFDADLEGIGSDDRYDQGKDSVWGLQSSNTQPSGAYGLMLTESPAPAPQTPFSVGDSQFYIEPFSGWNPNGSSSQSARRCIHGERVIGPTAQGDFVGRVLKPMGTFNPGQTKSVTYRYRRF